MASEEKMIIPKKQIAIALAVMLILIVVSIFWIIQSANTDNSKKNDLLSGSDANSNAVHFVKLILLENDCKECLSLEPLIDVIKNNFDVNVLEVKEVQADSEEGKKLIKLHGINKLPVLIINGNFQGTDLQQLWPEVGEEKNKALVLTKAQAPYYSLEEQRLVGKVDFLLIKNSSCTDCEDLSVFAEYIRDLNVLIENERTIEFDSDEAKLIMEEYLIDRIPVVFLSGDVNEYELFSTVWEQAGGAIDEEGVFTYREAVPYFDVFSKEVKGLVEITKLVDKNCSDCIDVNILSSPLIDQMRMKVVKEQTFDISSAEGKELIKKYLITKVPAIIVSSQAEEYIDFFTVWPEVGTQEEDGSFVFRNLGLIEGKFTSLDQNSPN